MAVMQLLLETGAVINLKDDFGRTPLSYAFHRGHQKAAGQLREQGASIKELNVKFDLITPTLFRLQVITGWIYFHERLENLLA
jgi:ankyrin repeat protein